MQDLLKLLCGMAVLPVLCGCSGDEPPPRKPTSPVTGQIYVDGAPPGSPIQVTCVSQSGVDTQSPTFSKCLTDNDGKFAINTYEQGDGVPPGEYVLTFMWGQMNLMTMGYSGPDKLKDRYSDPETSEHVLAVVEGLPTDLGIIELTTAADE